MMAPSLPSTNQKPAWNLATLIGRSAMSFFPRSCRVAAFLMLSMVCLAEGAAPEPAGTSEGVLPSDDAGKAVNVDFEKGTLDDWRAEGAAFARQPIVGDTVHARRSDMASRHAGTYWIGG